MKPNIKRILFSTLGAVAVASLVFASSIYAKKTLNPNELSHFFVPFPAGQVVRPMTVDKLDGDSIFVRPMTIYVDQRGILKKIFNPGVEGLSTHWLDNIDTVPHRIGLKFTGNTVDIEWSVNAGIPWDDTTHTFKVATSPGERIPDLGIDWLFFFSDETMSQAVWYDGSLIVFDADTNETLTTIPVTFKRSGAP